MIPTPQDHPTHYYYYESGPNTDRLYVVTDPRGNSTAYEYNQRGQVTKVQHQDYSYTQSGYNNDGTLAWTADENHPNASWNASERTSFTYDEYKRVLSVTNPLNKTTSFYYGLDWANPLVHTTSNPKVITSPMTKYTVFGYDENLRMLYQVQATWTPDEAWTWFAYDAVGNMNWTQDPRGYPTNFGYDARNRQTSVMDALGHVTSTEYDPAGNKNWIKRATGVVGWESTIQFVEYDPMNRLKHQIDERGVHTYMHYDDAARNLTSQEDGNGNSYSYTYDALKRKTVMAYPDTSHEDFNYDIVGNMATHRNRAGAVQTFASPDNRNRPTSFSWSDGTQGGSFEYDAASRVIALHNAEADIVNTYDAANRQTSETETIKSYGLWATRSTVYQHDDDGNGSRLIYPQGYQFLYGYTQRNQLDNIKLDPAIFGGTYNTPIVHYTYDPSGNRTTRTVLSGAHAEYEIDELNRVRGQWNYFSGSAGRFDYGFDALGRRTFERRDFAPADGYQYDPSDQVTGYQRDGTLNGNGTVSASFWNTTGLQYDNNGNRMQVTGNGADSYVSNSLNQYTSVSSMGGLGYDDGKGNLTSANGWTYGYDAQNRLTTIQGPGMTITQTYDPMNRVITRNVNGAVTQNVWDGWNLIEEHRADWSLQRCYLYGANQNEIVAAFDGGVYGTHWYWQDGRGNTSHITGDNAALLERYTYDLSGAPTFYDENGWERTASAYDTRFLFAGSQYLPDTGLYEMRNRFYHIALNRFLQTDPIGVAGDALNLHRYCGNDSVNGSDPSGLGHNDMNDQDTDILTLEGEKVTSTEIPTDPYAHETRDLWLNTPRLSDYFDRTSRLDDLRSFRQTFGGMGGAAIDPAYNYAGTVSLWDIPPVRAVKKWAKQHLSLGLNVNGPPGGGNIGTNATGIYASGGPGPGAVGEATLTLNINFGGTARGLVIGYSASLGDVLAGRVGLGWSSGGGFYLNVGVGGGYALYEGLTVGPGGYLHKYDHHH